MKDNTLQQLFKALKNVSPNTVRRIIHPCVIGEVKSPGHIPRLRRAIMFLSVADGVTAEASPRGNSNRHTRRTDRLSE
jgi:hypothetical protein